MGQVSLNHWRSSASTRRHKPETYTMVMNFWLCIRT